MYSVCNDPKGRVSPFGNLRIKACLLAPRSLSQATTSFIACNRQGIHHVHLFACPYNVSPLRLNKGAFVGIRSTLCFYVCSYIQSLPIAYAFRRKRSINNLYFYFFQIVKEQNSI